MPADSRNLLVLNKLHAGWEADGLAAKRVFVVRGLTNFRKIAPTATQASKAEYIAAMQADVTERAATNGWDKSFPGLDWKTAFASRQVSDAYNKVPQTYDKAVKTILLARAILALRGIEGDEFNRLNAGLKIEPRAYYIEGYNEVALEKIKAAKPTYFSAIMKDLIQPSGTMFEELALRPQSNRISLPLCLKFKEALDRDFPGLVGGIVTDRVHRDTKGTKSERLTNDYEAPEFVAKVAAI